MTKTVKAYAVFLPELRQLLSSGDTGTLKSVLREINPVDLAEGWKLLSREEQLSFFQVLSTRGAVVVFEELDVEDQIFLLQAMGEQATGQMVNELPPGEVAHLLRKLPPRVVRRFKNLVKLQEATDRLEQVLSYPPRTAGSLMHTETVRLKENLTASQALEMIQAVTRIHVHEAGILSTLYVVNGQGVLAGFVTLQALVAAPHDARIGELMNSARAISIQAAADQEEAARLVSKYNLISAPVVDGEGRLVGVLLIDDVLDIIHQEASEDIAKMVGTRPEEFSRQTILRAVWLRLPWLVASIIGGFIVSIVIKQFEGTLLKMVALASFLPLIAAMGGNVGAQSATIVVRGLAMGQVRAGGWWGVMLREMRVGLILGLSYGALVGALAYLLYGGNLGWLFCAVVAAGMLTSMTVAATIGAVEPFLFEKLGIDPATATGPLITTTTDLIATSAYLTLATVILL
ncbi:MAG: magnesium transporter [Candidatus Omnitrophica bacterium]|nr:magnesium transporter [Candidatus Omnitrophota bacterium]